MKKALIIAIAMIVVPWALGGCSSPSRVPVSLEPLNNWLLCHGLSTLHYPYSCPPCPYFGSAQAGEQSAPTSREAEATSPQRSQTSEEAGHPHVDANQ